MVDFAREYGCNIFSQNGEDGIIDEILRRIKMNHGISVEFGAPTKSYCSNTFNLDGLWQKYFFDVDPSEPGIIKKTISEQNVNELPKCNILSIDIDGNDYSVWKAYTGLPEIVVIEINSDYPPGAFLIHGIHHHSGTTYAPMVKLGLEKGYFLVCHTGNLIFLQRQYRNLFPEIIGDGIANAQDYFNDKWL